ncbi:hypothetical protein GCM10023083_12210 [Streptomyces phyllanthi]
MAFLQRYWRALTVTRTPSVAVAPQGHGRRGHSFLQRYWATLIGAEPPPAHAEMHEQAAADAVGTPVAMPAPRRPRPGPTSSGAPHARWFSLPRLPESAELLADDGDTVITEASSPDGRTEFVLRRSDREERGYTLEVTLRGFANLPALISIRFTGGREHRQELLVPLARPAVGPATAQITLPGFGADSNWEASLPTPVAETADWDSATLTASVAVAHNRATRDAWRQVRDAAPAEAGRAIDGAL